MPLQPKRAPEKPSTAQEISPKKEKHPSSQRDFELPKSRSKPEEEVKGSYGAPFESSTAERIFPQRRQAAEQPSFEEKKGKQPGGAPEEGPKTGGKIVTTKPSRDTPGHSSPQKHEHFLNKQNSSP